ncbi:hypothetical protein KEM56_001503 [Ascosphaera pollenicola]|nr:hypothetical protein KEM56_001503 [Ascosphaera pollenicola]
MTSPKDKTAVGSEYVWIDCNAQPTAQPSGRQLNLALVPGKLGSRNLRKSLDGVYQFIASILEKNPSQSILVTDDSGKDLAVGVALMILCVFCNDRGEYHNPTSRKYLDKDFIRQRLAWIMSAKSDANPSRATLQSVNSYLMERPI